MLARSAGITTAVGRLVATVAFAAATLAVACGPVTQLPAQTHASPRASVGAGGPAHVAVILMENQEYGDVVGSRDAPFINRLAHTGVLVTQMYGIAHPSLPNYLALTGGSTFGIHTDCTDCSVHATSLVDQLQSRQLSWKGYMEGLPHACFLGAGAGDYAKKHDPFAYYTRITSSPARCAAIVPLTQLATDERAGTLPRLIWISPNLCHDMHDCSLATGDRFLSQLVPPLLHALGRRGLLFLTWDEGSSPNGCCRLAHGGHIVTILAGPDARPGARLATATDHYSVLQTIEDVFGLPRLRGAACACTPSLGPLLRTG